MVVGCNNERKYKMTSNTNIYLFSNIWRIKFAEISYKVKIIVIPPNSNAFSDLRRSFHVSWGKTYQLPKANKTL